MTNTRPIATTAGTGSITMETLMHDQQLKNQPQMVQFCKRCVVSNQRPRIVFDADGICSACRYADDKWKHINWAERNTALKELLDRHRSKGAWDCIVPCSGGKDSSYVAHQLKHRYGMHPLLVTWAPFRYTDIGRKNFKALIDSGFPNITGYANGKVHRKLARLCFEALGDAWQPFAYGQMAFAFHMALRFGIKLIFFGENGEAEYGGDPKNNDKPFMPAEDWSELYYKGNTIGDIADLAKETTYGDNLEDLAFYEPPSPEALFTAGIQMHWYAYYHRWTPQENYYYACEHTGFKANPERSEGTYSKYASLDDKFDGFHYYLAYIKFGIGRATSDAAHEIRDGHITRDEGIALVRRYDGEFPKKYFLEFLDYLGISHQHFHDTVDRWRPAHLWTQDHGAWKLRVSI